METKKELTISDSHTEEIRTIGTCFHLLNGLAFVFSFIIHMCIQGLGHFSPLPPPAPLPPTLLPPSLPQYPAETILP
jgi:hypothetical protein